MFSVTNTGMNFRPLCTASVWPDHFRRDRRAARPGLDRAAIFSLPHRFDLFEQMLIDERAFLNRARHR
jgi:hypothetical protein